MIENIFMMIQVLRGPEEKVRQLEDRLIKESLEKEELKSVRDIYYFNCTMC